MPAKLYQVKTKQNKTKLQTESNTVNARDWRWGGNQCDVDSISVWEDEKVLETNGGDVCTM